MIEGYVEKPVSCAAIYQEQFFLTPDNMILPCCYVHSELTKNTYNVSTKANEFYNFLIDNNVKYDLDKFVRICGDRPFFSPNLVSEIIEYGNDKDFDVITFVTC